MRYILYISILGKRMHLDGKTRWPKTIKHWFFGIWTHTLKKLVQSLHYCRYEMIESNEKKTCTVLDLTIRLVVSENESVCEK